MKIFSLPFRTRLYISYINFLYYSCYAVVNLLLLPSTDDIIEHPEGFGGLNEVLDHLVVSQPSVPLHFSPLPLRAGGLNAFYRSFGCYRNQVLLAFLALALAGWWAQMDSDHRPHAYQACALTSWAMSPYLVEVIGFEPMTPCLQGRCSTSWAIPPFPK